MVVGSTGLIGRSLVHQLIKQGISVKALTRTDQAASDSICEYIKVNFDALELSSELLSDVKDMYICLGTTIKKAGSKEAFQKVDIQYCIDVAREAEKNGVRNLSIITSVGSDPRSSNFYLKTKGLIQINFQI